MWTHVHLECHIVWDDVLWAVSAVWADEDSSEPVVMVKRGRCPIGADSGPDAALLAAARALQGQALEEASAT